jgi:hypothetical protein
MSFAPFATPQDYFALDGLVAPGLSKVVTGPDITYTWEAPKSDSTSGAQKKFKGRELAKWSIDVQLYDDTEMSAWEDFWSLFRYPDAKPKTKLKSYAFGHPLVNMHGIADCTIQRAVTRQADTNYWVVSIEFEEDRKPVAVAVKVEGAAATPKADAKPPPSIEELQLKAAEDEHDRAGHAVDRAVARGKRPHRSAAVNRGASGKRSL